MPRRRPLLQSPRKVASRATNYLPPSNAEFMRDWTELEQGERVVFVEGIEPEVRGYVDTITEDGTYMWLYVEGGAGRRLLTRLGGGLVWRLPALV